VDVGRYRPVQVLLVDDSPDDVMIAQRAFRASRVVNELSIARDGQEAVELLRRTSNPPELVLLDIKLPRISGHEVLRRVRADGMLATLPVVMLSASQRREDVIESYRLGANSYIQKPVAFGRFQEILEIFATYWFEVATLPE
jgi:two-component system response regulator